jgi:hypothetical protein
MSDVPEVQTPQQPQTPIQTPIVAPTPQPAVANDRSFPYEYVKELRDEAAANRLRAKELEAKLSKTENDFASLKDMPEKYQKALSELKEIYLNKIPEEKREKFQNFDLENLKVVAEEWNQPVKNSPGTQTGTVDLAKGWDEMTEEELNTLAQQNPAHFQKLLNESIYGKKE